MVIGWPLSVGGLGPLWQKAGPSVVKPLRPVGACYNGRGRCLRRRPIMSYLAIALLSTATLLLELALLRVFAIQQFYHFAFMAISLALLGAGASGSLLSVRGRPFRLAPLALLFAATTASAYLIINYVPFDSYSIAWDWRQVLYLALYFLAAAAPFVFSGLAVGGELMRAGPAGRSHAVYGANLLGSAAGSLGSLPALALLGEVGAVLLAALFGALAALLVPRAQRLRHTVYEQGAALALLIAGLLLLFLRPDFLALRLSPYKTLPVLSQAVGAQRLFTNWNATSRVDVIASDAIHVMPGLSLLSPVPVPPQAGLLLDGDDLMPITFLSPETPEAQRLADHLPLGLAYRLRPGANTLILEAGTGLDVLLALAAGAESVTAVEDNALVIDAVRDHFAAETGDLYGRADVTVVQQSGRVFVRTPESGRYQIVVVSLTDAHRPVTSGAYSLTEDYVYTVEAFRDYLGALEEDGLLVVTRWLQWPPSEAPRTFGTLAAALRKEGQAPADHLVAFRTLRTVTILASPRPFTSEEIATVRDFLTSRGYDGITYPGITAGELNRFNVLQEDAYHDLFVRVLEEPETVYDDYRFDIRPPTDDHPFFFHYFKWRQTPEILASLGRTWQPFGGSGYFVLVALLTLVTLAAFVLIVAPLLLLRGGARPEPETALPWWRWRVFVYFAALGLAFLFVEVPLAQRFILVLDEPIIALSVVIFSILLFSGLGSLTVQHWSIRRALPPLVLLALLYPLLLPAFSRLALQLGEAGRVLATVTVLAPLGYLMGLPFAAGLRLVEQHSPALAPWAWAINGSFSVISSVLAVVVALTWSLPAVLYLGAAAYALAWLAFAAPSATARSLRG